jgi:putative MATE family efflux protein
MRNSTYIKSLHRVTKYLNRRDLSRILGEIKESISGTTQDFTTGSVGKAILLLSIPMVLEMLMESIFAIVDIFFVSKLGADAVATVGLTESLITIVYAVGIGLSMATTALVARRIGEKQEEGASKVAAQAIIAALTISLLIGIPGAIFAPELLHLMGADANTIAQHSGYTRWMLGGNVVIMLLFTINAAFRSAGDAAISMRVLLFANLINIVLDPILIFGLGPIPALGIEGAAIATNIGRGFAVLYQLKLLFGGRTRIKVYLKEFLPDFKLIGHLLKLSVGGIGQMIIATSSWIGLVRIISIYGNEALAGYTIAIRIIIFALLPSVGISNAAATLVGQNLGAGSPERAERSAYATGVVNMVVLGLIGLVFVLFPKSFVVLFTTDPLVVKYASECLQIVSFGFLSYGLGMVMVNAINGAGDTSTPTYINLFCYWLLEIPLAYFLAVVLGLHEQGVFYSILIAETVMTITAFIIFRRGKWKLVKV